MNGATGAGQQCSFEGKEVFTVEVRERDRHARVNGMCKGPVVEGGLSLLK